MSGSMIGRCMDTPRGYARQIGWSVALVIVALIVVACGDSSDEASTAPATTTPQIPEATEAVAAAPDLECRLAGYPCTLGDVADDVLVRSNDLAGEALDRIEAGAGTPETAAWLEGLDGMAEVESVAEAIRFRLDGGRGTWILTNEALGTRAGRRVEPEAAPTASRFMQASTRRADPQPAGPRVADHVVNEGSETKRARVLSPMLWDFADQDDGFDIATILNDTRGYAGNVDYQENLHTFDSDVSVDDFRGWRDFDVIHVASHGIRICKAGAGCRATIAAQALRDDAADRPGMVVISPKHLQARGLELATVEDPCPRGLDLVCVRVHLLMLTADFFKAEYGGGLGDTLIFFNACETYGPEATDLADALRGSTSMYLGWTEVVDSPDAVKFGLDFYRDLALRGSTVSEAYSRLGVAITPKADGRPQLVLGERRAGGDLRIREVVTLLDPDTGTPVSEGDIPIDGEPGDGEPDSVRFRVRVDGITDTFAPTVPLHVEIDGVEADPIMLDTSPGDAQDRREVSGVIDLAHDVEDGQELSYRAWVDLPSGGISEQHVGPVVSGVEPFMGRVWQVELDYSHMPRMDGVDPITATGKLTLVRDSRTDPADRRPTFYVTGGSVTYDFSNEDRFCRVTAPQISFEVTPEMAGFSNLTFDGTSEPMTFSSTIQTGGPTFSATYECHAGTGRDAPEGFQPPEDRRSSADLYWMGIIAQAGMVDETTRTFSGQSDDGDTKYTFTRIR